MKKFSGLRLVANNNASFTARTKFLPPLPGQLDFLVYPGPDCWLVDAYKALQISNLDPNSTQVELGMLTDSTSQDFGLFWKLSQGDRLAYLPVFHNDRTYETENKQFYSFHPGKIFLYSGEYHMVTLTPDHLLAVKKLLVFYSERLIRFLAMESGYGKLEFQLCELRDSTNGLKSEGIFWIGYDPKNGTLLAFPFFWEDKDKPSLQKEDLSYLGRFPFAIGEKFTYKGFHLALQQDHEENLYVITEKIKEA